VTVIVIGHLNRKSAITKRLQVMATARTASPAIVRRFEVSSSCSLSCWRKTNRWYALGVISSAVETMVATSAAK
jgi:hypothetical protein